jgi:hypothetical protein
MLRWLPNFCVICTHVHAHTPSKPARSAVCTHTHGLFLFTYHPLSPPFPGTNARIELPPSLCLHQGSYELCILSDIPTQGGDTASTASPTPLLPPAGCVLASLPLLVLPAAAVRELCGLLDTMTQEEVAKRAAAAVSGTPVAQDPLGALAPPSRGNFLRRLGAALGLACSAPPQPAAEAAPSQARAAAWRGHWRPLLDDLGLLLSLPARGAAGTEEMGTEGAGELARVTAVGLAGPLGRPAGCRPHAPLQSPPWTPGCPSALRALPPMQPRVRSAPATFGPRIHMPP